MPKFSKWILTDHWHSKSTMVSSHIFQVGVCTHRALLWKCWKWKKSKISLFRTFTVNNLDITLQAFSFLYFWYHIYITYKICLYHLKPSFFNLKIISVLFLFYQFWMSSFYLVVFESGGRIKSSKLHETEMPARTLLSHQNTSWVGFCAVGFNKVFPLLWIFHSEARVS